MALSLIANLGTIGVHIDAVSLFMIRCTNKRETAQNIY